MRLLKIDLPKHDTKSIYYVADNSNTGEYKEGKSFSGIAKAPTFDYRLAIKTASTVNGKKVYKRKVQMFNKNKTLINALAVMQGLRNEIKNELKDNAHVIAKIGAIQAKKQNYTEDENPHATRTLYQSWLEYYAIKEEKGLSEQTLKSYRTYFDSHLKTPLGKELVYTLDTHHFQAIINQMLTDRKAPRTAQTLQQIMRPLFKRELGLKGTLLRTNPILNTVIPRFNNEKTIDITDEQAKELMNQIYSYEDKKIRSVLIWLTHGRRAGEVRKLKWEHIDLEKGTYEIVAENNKARKTMRYQLTKTQIKALPKKKKEGYVFPSAKSKNLPLPESTLRPHWLEVVKRAGLENFRLHDLRHLIGGQLVSSGHSLEQIASVLGHTTTAVTQRYSKVRETVANEALNDFFTRVGM